MNSDCELMDDENEQPKENNEEAQNEENKEVKEDKEEIEEVVTDPAELEKLKAAAVAEGVFLKPWNQIHPHPRNVEIYNKVTKNDVRDMLINLDTLGQETNIVIDQHDNIISGVRRWTAIKVHNQDEIKKKKANSEYQPNIILCRCERRYLTDSEIDVQIVEFNKIRHKTADQIWHEMDAIEPFICQKAKLRRNSKLKFFDKSSVASDLNYQDEEGSTLHLLAQSVSISDGRAYYIRTVGKRAKVKDEKALRVMKCFKNGMSPNAGYQFLQLMDASENPKPDASQKDIDIANKAKELVKKIENEIAEKEKKAKDKKKKKGEMLVDNSELDLISPTVLR